MSNLKPPFRFALPQRDSDAILPAVLAAVLLLALCLQLLLRDDAVVPVERDSFVASWRHNRSLVLGPVVVPPAATSRSIFAPSGSTGADVAPNPLGGTAVVGAVRIGSRTYVVLQSDGGGVHNAGVGESVAGYRIDAITPTGVELSRAGERIELPYGVARAAPPAAAADTPPSEEDGQ
jgi:hypothetical protein